MDGGADLLIVGKFFLPIFLHNNVSTMPQFLEQRYGTSVRVVMAVFWLGLYVFVNLTSILWLGIAGGHTSPASIRMLRPMAGLGVFALAYAAVGRAEGRGPDRHRPGGPAWSPAGW
jgi:SSS family solute:Na+ symporter